MFKEYNKVRVIKLIHSMEEYDGWKINKRNPAIGDIGVIVEILHAPNLPDKYVVEHISPDAVPDWLGDFDAEEIESILS